MIINDYIQQKFQTFGIQLSKADLLDMCLSANLSGEDDITPDNHTRVHVSIARFIPSLLLRAQAMSEGGCSISWNIQGIKDYYFFLCSEHNLPNGLGRKIRIHDIADFL